MTASNLPEVWEWAEYYCPWCYITAVRLQEALPEYQGRVKLRMRPFPLEVLGSGPAPRDILDQEWWLAAIQEPKAAFAPFAGNDFPTTTLPAFEAVWCALQQDEALSFKYDLRIRRAFFAESRNIGRPEVLFELAEEDGLDMTAFSRAYESGAARDAVLAEGRIGKETFGVRGTPTVMLADGKRLHPPVAFPKFTDRKIVSIGQLPCIGDGCLDATRGLFEQAIAHHSSVGVASEDAK